MTATVAMKNALCTTYANNAVYGAVYTTTPGATAGAEPGAPYTRKLLSWSSPSNGLITASATFDISAGTTLVGGGVHSSASGGTYYDGGSVSTQVFTQAGTYTLTYTFAQS